MPNSDKTLATIAAPLRDELATTLQAARDNIIVCGKAHDQAVIDYARSKLVNPARSNARRADYNVMYDARKLHSDAIAKEGVVAAQIDFYDACCAEAVGRVLERLAQLSVAGKFLDKIRAEMKAEKEPAEPAET